MANSTAQKEKVTAALRGGGFHLLGGCDRELSSCECGFGRAVPIAPLGFFKTFHEVS